MPQRSREFLFRRHHAFRVGPGAGFAAPAALGDAMGAMSEPTMINVRMPFIMRILSRFVGSGTSIRVATCSFPLRSKANQRVLKSAQRRKVYSIEAAISIHNS